MIFWRQSEQDSQVWVLTVRYKHKSNTNPREANMKESEQQDPTA